MKEVLKSCNYHKRPHYDPFGVEHESHEDMLDSLRYVINNTYSGYKRKMPYDKAKVYHDIFLRIIKKYNMEGVILLIDISKDYPDQYLVIESNRTHAPKRIYYDQQART